MESIRTCLACRKKDIKANMMRFVRAPDGEICFDEQGIAASRGNWLCASKACVYKAFKRRLFFVKSRTLPVDAHKIYSDVQDRLTRSVLNRFGLLRKNGHLEGGRDAVLAMVRKDQAQAVVFAHDFSRPTRSKMIEVMGNVETSSSFFDLPTTMESMGACVGRVKTGVVALAKCRISRETIVRIGKLAKFSQ